jgi:GNAT superfamily N-acetyltransferase
MSKSNVKIRRAMPDDAEAVGRFWEALLEEQAEYDTRFVPAGDALARWQNDYREWVRAEMWRIFVAEMGGKVVGFVSAQPWYPAPIYEAATEIYINELYVRPTYRRHGIGRQLINAVRQWAEERGATRIRAGVLSSNGTGLDFWKACGAMPFVTTVTLDV